MVIDIKINLKIILFLNFFIRDNIRIILTESILQCFCQIFKSIYLVQIF